MAKLSIIYNNIIGSIYIVILADILIVVSIILTTSIYQFVRCASLISDSIVGLILEGT